MDSKKLASAVRELKNRVGDVIDDLDPDIATGTDDLRNAKDLLGVLAHIVDGKPIDKAFGSPGDWGYGTEIGSALASRC